MIFGKAIAVAGSEPATESLQLAEVKAHLRVRNKHEDGLIAGLMRSAREYVEFELGEQQLVTATYDVFADRWPRGRFWYFPKPPLQTVTTVKYQDEDDVQQTFTGYHANAKRMPGCLILKDTETWPTLLTGNQPNIIEARIVAGYGDAVAVPQKAKQAQLLLVGHWFRHRDVVDVAAVRMRQLRETIADLLSTLAHMSEV